MDFLQEATEKAMNSANAPESSAPESDLAPDTTQNLEGSEPTEKDQPEVVELESLERFKYGGKELTAKELNSMIMMESDYRRKTQSLAEERRNYETAIAKSKQFEDFDANYRYDRDKILRDPSLRAQFNQIYPPYFHKKLDQWLERNGKGDNAANTRPQIDPELGNRISRLETQLFEKEVQSIEADLTNKFQKLTEQNPFADEDIVITKGIALRERLAKENRINEFNDKTWDKLFKDENDRVKAKYEQHYKEQFKNQKSASTKAKDVARGGGTPAQAPKRLKLNEVEAAWLQSLKN